MSKKSTAIAALVEQFRGQELNARYLEYFECFNRQHYFEAHAVLEELWLAQRNGVNGSFYKGLIQLAGAFVHLQKNRLRPAGALFKLAEGNLKPYLPVHEKMDVDAVLSLIQSWLRKLEPIHPDIHPLAHNAAPKLKLRLGTEA